jgi:phosphonopyruvate decarboxylase
MDPKFFYEQLLEEGVNFFTGVPDSLLKEFCAFLADNVDRESHVIAANEGGAVALAMGAHMATDGLPLIYLQNSGVGNIINPLLSLTDSAVYSIPSLLLIGWRGEPGIPDEPQHVKQGKVMLSMLDAMDISYDIIDADTDLSSGIISKAAKKSRDNGAAHALIVRKNTFNSYIRTSSSSRPALSMTREAALGFLIDRLEPDDIVVATTGMISRELFEYRQKVAGNPDGDFLTVGGMGHASQIALGIALKKKQRRIICIDGDGALLMHAGALAISGSSDCANFYHIVLNNGAHDSVGGQDTVAFDIDLTKLADAAKYNTVESAANEEQLAEGLTSLLSSNGPSFLEVKVRKGNRNNLGRPNRKPVASKDAFMNFCKK